MPIIEIGQHIRSGEMLKVYEFIYPSIEGQIDFIPERPVTGLNISVLKNGVATDILPFTIVDEVVLGVTIKYLRLDIGLSINDHIVVCTESNAITPVGDYGNVFTKRYETGVQRLLNNQIYEGSLIIDGEPIGFHFTSRYDPLYCTAKVIQQDIDHIATLSEDAINFLIYDQSMRVMTFMNGGGDLNYTMPTPYLLKDPTKIPYNIQQHVRYSVEKDIINAVYLSITGSAGKVSKKLGDMEISKAIQIPYLKDMLRAIEEKLKQFPLTGAKIIVSVIKGNGNTPWPVNTPRRSF